MMWTMGASDEKSMVRYLLALQGMIVVVMALVWGGIFQKTPSISIIYFNKLHLLQV
jgi:hypothetical protein